MRVRRLALGSLIAVAAYAAVLVIAGWLAAGMVERRLRDRLATSLDAEVAVGEVSLGLVRGSVAVRDVAVERRHLGVLRLAIERIDVDIAPLGLAAIDRSPHAIRLRGGHLLVSGAGALDGLGRRHHTPVHVDAVVITASELTIVATTLWPELARVHLAIDEVRAGPTTFRTPLSWIFALRALSARVSLPGGVAFTLTYRDGVLSAQGSLFGDTPIEVPVSLTYDPAVDEPTQLRALAFTLAKRLAVERARRWFWSRALRSFAP